MKTYDVFKVVDGEWVWVRDEEAESPSAVIDAIDEVGRWYVMPSFGRENIMLPRIPAKTEAEEDR